MADAPFCNVKLVAEPGNPQPAKFQRIPQGASNTQIINIVNNNFKLLSGPFVENGRASEVVRIYNPNDNSQFVDVRQIVGLRFVNPYGQTLVFRR